MKRSRPRAGEEAFTVLVVDDNEVLRSYLERFLTSHRLRVLSAHDGRGALEQFEHGRPDLVLLDPSIPDMVAPETAAWMRAQDASVPIVYMVGSACELPAGEQHLRKPFRSDEVLERVRFAMGLRHPRSKRGDPPPRKGSVREG